MLAISRTPAQEQATKAAEEALAAAKQALIDTLWQTTLQKYHDHAAEDQEFCVVDENGDLRPIQATEPARDGGDFWVWSFDSSGNEVLLGCYAPDAPAYFAG